MQLRCLSKSFLRRLSVHFLPSPKPRRIAEFGSISSLKRSNLEDTRNSSLRMIATAAWNCKMLARQALCNQPFARRARRSMIRRELG